MLDTPSELVHSAQLARVFWDRSTNAAQQYIERAQQAISASLADPPAVRKVLRVENGSPWAAQQASN